ncbi:eukaryotic aspartyl protease [Opisthorchis viverrini]|uniref:Eukaryotic aspartyl protease n=1 Tax=Opisthorchis viverrini TaxID=6198 RepID=A0A1S8XA33_OPIVI|nr:eukaryotic aspartyl protease [Opisthorchis viverrini]
MQLSLALIIFIFATTHCKTNIILPIRLRRTENEALFAASFPNSAKMAVSNLAGLPGMGYYLPVTLGNPPQELNLLVDTGSADLAVAGRKLANVDRWFNASASSTLECSGFSKQVRYQQGSWIGPLCKDRLTLVLRNMSHNQSITRLPPVPIHFSLIEDAQNFFLSHYGSTWEGIIGLGYPKLMMDNIPSRQNQVEQVLSHSPWIRVLWKLFEQTPEQLHPFETLTSAWNLPNMFSLLLCGLTQQSFSVIGSSPVEMNGLLLIGGMNLTGMTQTVNTILYTPVREPWFYEVVLTDLRVEEQSVVEDCKELNVEFSIVDSGTTNIQVPERVFQPLLGHIKTYVAKQSSSTATMLQNYASFWAGASMLCEASSDNQIGGASGLPHTLFPVIEFQMLALGADMNKEALSLTLSPQQYIRFVGRHPKDGVMRDCFAFGIRPHHSGTILGAVFLEGFFTVFHRNSLKVGAAKLFNLHQPHFNTKMDAFETNLFTCTFNCVHTIEKGFDASSKGRVCDQ